MAKSKKLTYSCVSCGAKTATWAGRCHVCGDWNTLEVSQSSTPRLPDNQSLKLESLSQGMSESEDRLVTNIAGLDIIFGGGIVKGSVNLLSGEPGIGKSTLLLAIASNVASNYQVLYASGEESSHQISIRYNRLKLNAEQLQLASTNSADAIIDQINSGKYSLVIIDSIQTIRLESIATAAGTLSQVTNSAALITQAAKISNTAVIMVGHVTKEGNIAGPKLLEHIVDVVINFEGDQSGGLRLLRSTKNRFGSTNETAIFEMKETGLEPVANPSAVLLDERKITDGSVVLATMEGSRPLLVEVQALVNNTNYGYAKRAVSGFDLSRLNLLVAMMERRTSLKLSEKDIYVNIVGGLKISEPAADLAVVMAIASAAREKKLKDNAVVFGEIGLSGEIRRVPFMDRRVKEAKLLGFDYAIGPKNKDKTLSLLKSVPGVREALNQFLS